MKLKLTVSLLIFVISIFATRLRLGSGECQRGWRRCG